MADVKQGKALEILVASLEKILTENPNVIIHSPMRLRDRTTGMLREHDVVLEFSEGHHSLLVAIECRDRSRPVGVPQIEAFSAKCLDTGVSQGVIVSTTGYYNTARTKAKHLSISCLDIEEAENFNWLLAPGIRVRTRHILSNDWTFFPVEDGIVEKNEAEVIDIEGNLLNMPALTANAQQQLTLLLSEDANSTENAEMTVKFPGNGLLIRSRSTGETVSVNFAIALIRYSIKEELIPFRLIQYQSRGTEENITDAAYADLKIGDNEARLMIVFKEDKGGRVVFIPKSS